MTQHTITKKQQELLLLLYRFRFLNRVQFQKLFNHKTFNRIIVWLNDLTDKGYTEKIIDADSKMNTSPTIYYIGKNGIKFLNTQENCEKAYIARMYSEWKKSTEFVHRCLLIGDMYIHFNKTSNIAFYTQSDYSVSGIIREIFPDFVYRRGERYYLGKFIMEKPRKAIRACIDKYVRYYTSTEGKNHASVSTFLFICPNEDIEKYVIKKIKKALLEENIDYLKFNTSTLEQIKQEGIDSKIWNSVTID